MMRQPWEIPPVQSAPPSPELRTAGVPPGVGTRAKTPPAPAAPIPNRDRNPVVLVLGSQFRISGIRISAFRFYPAPARPAGRSALPCPPTNIPRRQGGASGRRSRRQFPQPETSQP